MKQFYRILLLMIFVASTFQGFAYDFEVDGICYNKLSNTEVEVTYRTMGYPSYYGFIVIPATVRYENVTYSVTAIGEKAFFYCESHLAGVVIPNSVKSIGESAFYKCYDLRGIKIPNSLTEIGDYAFYSCGQLRSIEISNSVKSIGDYAFSDCTSLRSIEIPNSVTEIGECAFRYCENLESIVIGNSVKSIGDYAFQSLNNLQMVTCLGRIPPLAEENIFSYRVYRSIGLYVPEEYINNYKTTTPWSNFFEILGGTSGVSTISDNRDSVVSVYSINGTIVKKACRPEDLKQLDKGVYIIVCGNERYKISI